MAGLLSGIVGGALERGAAELHASGYRPELNSAFVQELSGVRLAIDSKVAGLQASPEQRQRELRGYASILKASVGLTPSRPRRLARGMQSRLLRALESDNSGRDRGHVLDIGRDWLRAETMDVLRDPDTFEEDDNTRGMYLKGAHQVTDLAHSLVAPGLAERGIGVDLGRIKSAAEARIVEKTALYAADQLGLSIEEGSRGLIRGLRDSFAEASLIEQVTGDSLFRRERRQTQYAIARSLIAAQYIEEVARGGAGITDADLRNIVGLVQLATIRAANAAKEDAPNK